VPLHKGALRNLHCVGPTGCPEGPCACVLCLVSWWVWLPRRCEIASPLSLHDLAADPTTQRSADWIAAPKQDVL